MPPDPVPTQGKYAMLVVVFGDGSPKLKTKVGKIPALDVSAAVGVARKRGGYHFSCELDEFDVSEGDMPNPLKNLIDGSAGGVTFEMDLPPVDRVIRDWVPIPYPTYRANFFQRHPPRKNQTHMVKPLPEPLYRLIARLYLEQMGAPLYL